MPDKKLDRPDEVAFIKEIVRHIPGDKEHKENMRRVAYTVAGGVLLGVAASVANRKPK